jgi:hypothetical protein
MDLAMTASFRARIRSLRNEEGTTLIETTIACAILLVTMAGLLSLGALATMHTENEGHLSPRTTEYAQDKMEQLLALAYGDLTSNTIVFPATPAGGTGLAIGGSSLTNAPVAGYVDWLAGDGTLLGGGVTPPTSWFYERVWKTSMVGGVKQLEVTVTVRSAIAKAMLPKSSVVAVKASQF